MAKKKEAISSIQLERSDGTARTTQKPDKRDVRIFGDDIVYEPPLANDSLINVFKTNNIIKRSVDFFAKNFVAAGFDIVPDGDKEYCAKHLDERKEILQWFEDCVDEGTFMGLIKKAKVDQKVCGHSAIELARNKLTGKPEKLFYVPIDTIRIAKKKKGFKSGQRFVQYEDYGTMNEGDAVWFNKYEPNSVFREDGSYGFKEGLNEIIWNKEINPSDKYYGLSPIGAIIIDHMLGVYSKEYNLNEFENGMLQKLAIVVKNGALTEGSIASIKEFFSTHLKGTKKQQMIPVLNCVGQKSEVNLEQISKEMKEGSFLSLLDYVDQQGFVALGVPPVLLGIVKDANRSNSQEQRDKFIEDEIMPEHREDETILKKLIQKDLGFPNWKFVYRENKMKATKEANEVASTGVKDGSFSINDKLRHLGRDPIVNQDGTLNEGAEMHVITTDQGVVIPVDKLPEFAKNWNQQAAAQSVDNAKNQIQNFQKYLEDVNQTNEIMNDLDDDHKKKLAKAGFHINKVPYE